MALETSVPQCGNYVQLADSLMCPTGLPILYAASKLNSSIQHAHNTPYSLSRLCILRSSYFLCFGPSSINSQTKFHISFRIWLHISSYGFLRTTLWFIPVCDHEPTKHLFPWWKAWNEIHSIVCHHQYLMYYCFLFYPVLSTIIWKSIFSAAMQTQVEKGDF